MAFLSKNASIFALIALFTFATTMACTDMSNSYLAYNTASYNSTDPYAKSVDYVLRDLQCKTPKTKRKMHYVKSPFGTNPAYGNANCSSTISAVDCAICIAVAKEQMMAMSKNPYGARMVMKDCQLQYDVFRG